MVRKNSFELRSKDSLEESPKNSALQTFRLILVTLRQEMRNKCTYWKKLLEPSKSSYALHSLLWNTCSECGFQKRHHDVLRLLWRDTFLLFILFQCQTYGYKYVEEGRRVVYTHQCDCFHMFFFIAIFTVDIFMKQVTQGNV